MRRVLFDTAFVLCCLVLAFDMVYSVSVPLKRLRLDYDYLNEFPKASFLEKADKKAFMSITKKILGNSTLLNYYYIEAFIGSKTQKQNFIVDTGSPMLSLPCKSTCQVCGNHNERVFEDKGNQPKARVTDLQIPRVPGLPRRQMRGSQAVELQQAQRSNRQVLPSVRGHNEHMQILNRKPYNKDFRRGILL